MNDIASKCSSMEDMKEELITLVKRLCEDLHDLWMVFGVKTRQQKACTVLTQLGTLMQKILVDEKKNYQRVIDNINVLNTKILRLCQEMSIPPFKQPEGLFLSDLESVLNAEVVALENERKHRIERFRDLTLQEQELCSVLAMQPYPLGLNKGVPSSQQLAELQYHVTSLKVEKEKRVAKVRLLRRNMEQLKEELEFSPRTPFIRKTFFGPENDILSNETISKISMLKERMEVKNKENKTNADALKQRLLDLWEMINTDPQEREHFLKEHPGNKPSSIRALHCEVQRCEALGREMIETLIKKKRTQIEELWKKCYTKQEEKNNFLLFLNGSYSKEVLSLHEAEVRKWQNYYTRWSRLFESIENLKAIWKRIKEFEEKQKSNPKRFANRGGGLLQEEKIVRRLSRELQETEDALQALASEYEQQEMRVFCMEGRTVPEIVAQHRDEYAREKGRIFKQAKLGPAKK